MDLEEEWRAVFTCDICETISEEYINHACLKDYNDVYLDENYYFYPLLDDKVTIVRRALLKDGTEGIIQEKICIDNNTCSNHTGDNNTENENSNICQSLKSVKRKMALPWKPRQVQKRGKLDDDELEILIMEVERRIPLWNFDIPIEERSRETVAALWQEVSDALNGRLSAEDAKTKFKSLRDTHRKIIRAEHRASGSARIDTKKQWKFYRCCEFLRDSCLLKPTSSNITGQSADQDSDNDVRNNNLDSSVDNMCNIDESISETYSQISDTPRIKKNRNRTGDTLESQSMQALNRIADIMCKETPPLVLPERSTMDAIDHFLNGAGHEIRQLPETQQFDACMQVLNLIHSLRRQYPCNNKY